MNISRRDFDGPFRNILNTKVLLMFQSSGQGSIAGTFTLIAFRGESRVKIAGDYLYPEKRAPEMRSDTARLLSFRNNVCIKERTQRSGLILQHER